MSAAYVRETYGVDFKRGDRVSVDGRPGTIVSFPGQYLGVRFDGEKHTSRAHPTWHVERIRTPVSVDDIAAALVKRYRYANEIELHAGLSAALTAAGITHEREVPVNGGRIDFLIGSVGVEVKIKGTIHEIRRQLARYCAEPRIDTLLLVTTRPAHRQVLAYPFDVPVNVLTIGGLGL